MARWHFRVAAILDNRRTFSLAARGEGAASMSLVADSTGRLAPDQARSAARDFDLKRLPDDFFADPYRYYAALREHDPVHRMPDGAYFLTRWRDCDAVYRDAHVFSSDKKVEFLPKFGDAPLYGHHTTSLVFNDPPLHTHVRRAIQTALSNRVIAEMEAGLVALVDRLIGAMAEKGRAHLIEDFSAAIPVEVIGNLLGVPAADRAPLRDWSLAILGALEPVLTPAQLALGNDAVCDFATYLEGLVEDRRRNPGDPDKDLLTRLIGGEHAGRKLDEDELLQNCIFILNAGHETTTNLIGNALEIFVRFPAERRRLIENPALARSAVEEALRFESSNQLGNRIVTADTQLGGVAMPKGTLVTIGIGAPNRDPDTFADPDRFDAGRNPTRHLAFGSGIHMCAVMSLARLEGRIAIERFLARFPHYEPEGPPLRSRRARFRGFTAMPVRLNARA